MGGRGGLDGRVEVDSGTWVGAKEGARNGQVLGNDFFHVLF